jgi:hypothetical protein
MEDTMSVDGSFEVRRLGSDGLFGLFGELDMTGLDGLFKGLRRGIDGGGTLTLDLSKLKFLDLVGGHAIGVVGSMIVGRGSVVLLSPSHGVLKVLKLIGAGTFPGVYIPALLQSA